MNSRLIAVTAVSWLTVGCGVVSSAAHGYDRYTNPSGAMEPTIQLGQTVNARPVEQGKYTPKRGDVVIFTQPAWSVGKDTPFVKRVIAIGGDTIGCCSSKSRLTLNGSPLSEPYLAPKTAESPFGPITVPAGRLWMMGDNRAQSGDSRHHVAEVDQGTVPVTAVVGVVVLQ